LLLVGLAQHHRIDDVYVVGIVPGVGCDDAHDVHVRVEDGAVLDCLPSAVSFASGRVHVEGFIEAQQDHAQPGQGTRRGRGTRSERAKLQSAVDAPPPRSTGTTAVRGAGSSGRDTCLDRRCDGLRRRRAVLRHCAAGQAAWPPGPAAWHRGSGCGVRPGSGRAGEDVARQRRALDHDRGTTTNRWEPSRVR